MKEKNSFLDKISVGKNFYITAGLSVASVIVAVLVLYSTTSEIAQDYISTTENTTEQQTQEAEINVTNEVDPRYEEDELDADEFETTTIQSTTIVTTIEQTTEAQEVAVTPLNTSYILPIDTDILKPYSIDSVIYSETMGDWRVHTGIDFYASEDDEILSVGNGTVSKVSAESSWGYVIEVDYGDFTARYCGMKQGTTVSIGTVLSQGDVIGNVDYCPCEASDETHLHFEVLIDGEYVEPLEALGF